MQAKLLERLESFTKQEEIKPEKMTTKLLRRSSSELNEEFYNIPTFPDTTWKGCLDNTVGIYVSKVKLPLKDEDKHVLVSSKPDEISCNSFW